MGLKRGIFFRIMAKCVLLLALALVLPPFRQAAPIVEPTSDDSIPFEEIVEDNIDPAKEIESTSSETTGEAVLKDTDPHREIKCRQTWMRCNRSGCKTQCA